MQYETNLEWKDIEGEVWRAYIFAEGKLVIERPVKVAPYGSYRGEGGPSHRLIDEKGCGYYVPAGWYAIQWANEAGVHPARW